MVVKGRAAARAAAARAAAARAAAARAAAARDGGRGDGGGDGGDGKGGGEGGGREPSLLMWYAAGDGEELAEDGHVAQDGEQHGLPDLDRDLILLLVAGLPWKVGKA